jgi:hypothetical protein
MFGSMEEAISLIEKRQELEILKSYVAKVKTSVDNNNNNLSVLINIYN